ncbi:MAG TPA: SHOCT domain-containing protein [Candidatus Angelobacter sp.]|jgi:hypothetical protein|nr:SHOCT domain-containing protein [Candidatus Angelobacter sp.]
MNLRRLYILLAVWCAFVIAPGVLTVLGIFGRIDIHTNISGGLVLLWLVGYLGQFAIFMWMMNIVGKQRILWWLLASLLPWAVDWTLPVSPLFLLLWLPVVTALAGWIALVAQQADSLQRQGIRATGTVLEVLKPWMNVVINNVYIKRKVRLRIERDGGVPAYEGTWNTLFMLGEIPSPGDRIPLLVDPAKPQRFEYRKETGYTPAAPNRRAASHAAGGESIADELEKLAHLRERGVITDSEFDAAKKKVLRRD